MICAVVKGFFKFYPVIFHKKGRFAGVFRIFGDGELVFEMQKGRMLPEETKGGPLQKTKGGIAPRRSPLFIPPWARGGPRGPRNDIYPNGRASINVFVF